MRLTVNGNGLEARSATLEELLAELDYAGRRIATAVNGELVPRGARARTPLKDGDRVEILSPMQGG